MDKGKWDREAKTFLFPSLEIFHCQAVAADDALKKSVLCRPGVSNTWPASRKWPAWRVYAARVIIKISFIVVETTVLCDTRAPPTVARGNIFAYLCGPQALFSIKMWPAYTFEFETPGEGPVVGLKIFLRKETIIVDAICCSLPTY